MKEKCFYCDEEAIYNGYEVVHINGVGGVVSVCKKHFIFSSS